MTPDVDVLVVFRNSRRWLPGFFEGLRRISIPITALFLDNNSADGTADLLETEAAELPFPTFVFRSNRNNGFARGVNLLSQQSRAEFMFLLNPDTCLEENCLEALLERVKTDSRIGICDARQTPREHPKAWDSQTGETTWCSGAAALVRRKAFDEAGGFDELFFMYCEDIDLSWKLWLRNWKCVYVPTAVVQHFTQDVVPGKKRTGENYWSFMNSLLIFYRFGSKEDRTILWSFLQRRFFSRRYSWRSKTLFTIALVMHFRYIPYVFRGDRTPHPRHRWVRLTETSLSQ